MIKIIYSSFTTIGILVMIIILSLLCIITIFVMKSFKTQIFTFLSKFLYTPKKCPEIFDIIWAHRGSHVNKLENTLNAYSNAIKSNMGIEIDIRQLKDKNWVCFHDRYTMRLLGFPGKFTNRTYKELKKHNVLNSNEKVPLLKETLDLVNNQVPILLEVKGYLKKSSENSLIEILNNYDGRYYFHVKNILTYFRLKKIWKNKVIYILNPFRKRLNFIKGVHYKGINIPTGYDLIISVEEGDTVKTVVNKLWYAYNKYTTRINKNDSILTKGIAHRCIVDKSLPEHSIEAIRKCVELDVIPEIDIVWYKGELRCYHSDTISNKLGQKTSCAEKLELENSITLKSALIAVNEEVEIILDIKDANPRNRRIEIEIIRLMKELNYKGKYYVQSYNPLVLKWFMKNHPEILRGMVGNSLNSFEKTVPDTFRFWLGFILFYKYKPDFIVYDFGKLFFLLFLFNKIIGQVILGYDIHSKTELDKYNGFYDNAIIEDLSGDTWKDCFYINEYNQLRRIKTQYSDE